MKMLSTIVLALACAFPLMALAQWQWMDKDGRKVYSDRPPPPEIPEIDVLKKPVGGHRTSAPSAVNPAAPASAAQKDALGAGKVLGKDPVLEAKKKQMDDEEEAKRKAAAGKQGQDKTQNCERARSSLAVLQSGIRMKVPNANGEMEFISDANRAAEIERVQGIVSAECK